MALEVEDGTGKVNAESFCSLATANARHSAFGNTGWSGADDVKEAALRRATAYMEQTYRSRWQGFRHNHDQALSWPRNSVVVDEFVVVESDVVPLDVQNACADLALRALSDDLAPDLTRGIVREKVGPLETEYDRYSPQSTRYSAIDMALAPYLQGGGANARLVRA